jgi:hypothetical protein
MFHLCRKRGMVVAELMFYTSKAPDNPNIMNVIHWNAPFDGHEIRERIYQGDIVILEPTESSRRLCRLAADLCWQAFLPLNPVDAHLSIPVEDYVAVLARLKPKFIHHPKAKELIRVILEERAFDVATTYFDVPRLRSMTNREYLSSGIALSFHPHRDTWYSAPLSQINWWVPVFGMTVENGIAFHPEFWDHPIANTSHVYNYEEWKRTGRSAAAAQIHKDTRVQPEPLEAVDLETAIKPVVEPGSFILFSAAQLHSSIPNKTDETRFSIDFRTVDINDIAAFRGAPNIDSRCTGTTLGDFLRADTLEKLPAQLAREYSRLRTQPIA